VIVGRSAKCDVVVRDPDVSRRHLRLELENGEVWAEDMGSSNGSTLEGEPLSHRSRVAEGQVLRICDHEIRVRILPTATTSSEMAAGPPPLSMPAAQHAAATQGPPAAQQSAHGFGQAAQDHGVAHDHSAHDPSAHGYSAHGQEPAPADTGAHQAQYAYQPLVAPAHGRVEVPADAQSSPRTFECSEALWQSYEHMAREAGVSVDDLINEALSYYGRRRVYANAGSATQPQTSLQFVPRPPSVFELAVLPKR
jgi:predicted component of type VI protein secretion system